MVFYLYEINSSDSTITFAICFPRFIHYTSSKTRQRPLISLNMKMVSQRSFGGFKIIRILGDRSRSINVGVVVVVIGRQIVLPSTNKMSSLYFTLLFLLYFTLLYLKISNGFPN